MITICTCQSGNNIRNLLVVDHVAISKGYTKKVFVTATVTQSNMKNVQHAYITI